MDELLRRTCVEAGIRRVVGSAGLRQVLAGLRENRWTVMLADQDVGTRGLFVPFLGRPCSTTPVPAELSLRTGAPILMAFITRREDRRNEIDVLPPLTIERPEAPDGVERLTALHVAVLGEWVRRHPHMYFWLHRRWKTRPPAADRSGLDAGERDAPGPAPIAREA